VEHESFFFRRGFVLLDEDERRPRRPGDFVLHDDVPHRDDVPVVFDDMAPLDFLPLFLGVLLESIFFDFFCFLLLLRSTEDDFEADDRSVDLSEDLADPVFRALDFGLTSFAGLPSDFEFCFLYPLLRFLSAFFSFDECDFVRLPETELSILRHEESRDAQFDRVELALSREHGQLQGLPE
jgi:hypothetical protein